MTNRKKCVLPIYLFLSVLLKSTSLKFWFYILDFSALDINLSSLNCNQGTFNSVTEENKFFYHKIFKNPLTIISNQDIFFSSNGAIGSLLRNQLRENLKTNFLSFHSFDTLPQSINLVKFVHCFQFWQIPYQRFA